MRIRPAPPRRPAPGSRLTRRASMIAALGVAAALVVTPLTPVTVSQASWTDGEWDHGGVGTLSCADTGIFQTRGAGRLLGGGLLPTDLDTLAAVGGVTVTNDGTAPHPDPAAASGAGDAFVHPLDVGLLGTVRLPLTGTALDQLLSLPLATDVGAVNQYALAADDGLSRGASGVVNDSGVIQTDVDDNGEPPALGTLELSTLVEQLTGTAVSGVVAGIADLRLELGAVASSASLDACDVAWDGDIDAHLDREYAIAGLKAEIDAPIVAGLSGTLTGLLDGLQTSLDGLAGDAGVTSAITAGVGELLSGVLGALSLGSTTITGPAITVDLSSVRSLTTATIGDDAGTVTLDLSTGAVQVDLAALIGQAYGGQGFNSTQAHGLNGLPPNTELIVNDDVTNALIAALTEALDGWVQDVVDALRSALYAAGVSTTIDLVLGGTVLGTALSVASVRVTVNGTLASLLDGGATIDARLSLLGGECRNPILDLVPCAIAALVDPLVSGIIGALTGGVAPLIGGVLETAVFGADGIVPRLGATLSDATAPVISALSGVLVAVLGVNGLASLRANVQNTPTAGSAPDPDPVLTYPDWEGVLPDGQYDVAALGVGVLNALGPGMNVNLELARSSVGTSCAVATADPRCSGY